MINQKGKYHLLAKSYCKKGNEVHNRMNSNPRLLDTIFSYGKLTQ